MPDKLTIEKIDDIIQQKIIDFANEIKNIKENTGNTDIMDILVTYAKKNNIEIEVIGDLIKKTPELFLDLTKQAEEKHLIEKTNRLF